MNRQTDRQTDLPVCCPGMTGRLVCWASMLTLSVSAFAELIDHVQQDGKEIKQGPLLNLS